MSAPFKKSSHRERDEDYYGVVVDLCPSRRVIRCKDDQQWIVQRNERGDARPGRWTGQSYCLTRKALIRLCRASASPDALEMLRALPATYPRGPQ